MNPMDPRISIIDKRLAGIDRILMFASSKGGVGKSVCAAAAALLLAKRGLRVGLLDLDFHGASAHVILNAPMGLPEESGGILPRLIVYNLAFMSIANFTGENPVPLRGEEISNALIELLTVTLWKDRDYLIIDMPPGIGDELLDVIRLIKRAEAVVITTPSLVAEKVVGRLLEFLAGLHIPVRGVIENMKGVTESSSRSRPGSVSEIPFCSDLEGVLGKPEKLAESRFAVALEGILMRLIA
jgi:ATP-binding protein involved in chromosome partitioning